MKLDYPPGATPLDPNETEGLLPSSIATQADLNALEQANILDAQRWALKGRRRNVLSERFVRHLHRRMFHEVWRWAGTYRRSNKNLGIDWPQIPVEIQKLCQDAEYWVAHQTYGWDELGARFHHRLVSVHPFPNGNGRHARLMTDVLLKAQGKALFSWGAEGDLGEPSGARARYIEALRTADQRDYNLLIKFVRS